MRISRDRNGGSTQEERKKERKKRDKHTHTHGYLGASDKQVGRQTEKGDWDGKTKFKENNEIPKSLKYCYFGGLSLRRADHNSSVVKIKKINIREREERGSTEKH